MAYDPSSGLVVLFGGQGNGLNFLGDTWTWNGTTWTQLSPATSPQARGYAVMAYDAAFSQVLLFGGEGNGTGFPFLNDTWTWNGTTWTQLAPVTSPEARFSATMAYDPSSGQVVLFGGGSNSGFLGDTWTLQQGPLNLGSANVCTAGATTPSPCSQTTTLAFDVAAGTTIGSINVLTQGAPNLDFKAATTQESNACATQTYTSAATCTVNVTFAPEYPGQRLGAVVIEDGTGNVLATTYVFGTGQGPQVSFSPASQITVANTAVNGLNAPDDIAVDASGNVYIVDNDNSRLLKEAYSAGAYTQSVLFTGLNSPKGVAIDGAGNIYLALTGADEVVKETLSGTSYTQTTIGSGFSSPDGVAVDGSGNVYIADSGGNEVFKETLSNGSYIQSAEIGSGLNNPWRVVVDGSGNLYVADTGNNQIVKETPSGGSYTQSTIATGLNQPHGLTLDANTNLYIADTNNNQIVKETLSGSSYTQSIIVSGLDAPREVELDGSGNLYIDDINDNSVYEEPFATAPTLTFLTATDDGTTDTSDGALSVTIASTGNEPLTAISPGLSVAADFAQTSGSCTASFSLAANASCSLSVEFEPVVPASGTVDGSVVLTDNNLNVTPSASQTIPLVGTAVLGNMATHYSISAPSTYSSYVLFQINITALDASNNPATGYNGMAGLTSSDSAPVFLTNPVTFINGIAQPVIALKAAGSQTVTATDTTNSSITGSTSILVTPGPTSRFILSAPATATSGTAFNFTVTAADLFGNTTPAYSGTVHFSSTDGLAALPANSTLTNGVGTFPATLKTVGNQTITATDTVTSSIAGASGTITVSKLSTITNLVLSAGTVASGSPVTLTATVTAAGNPVTNGIVSFYQLIGSELVPLGDAQIVAANSNSATLKSVFGPGTTTVVAKFHTTALLQSSEPTAQTVTVTGLDATATAIASSGSVDNYTLTGTVTAFGVSAPAGSVSFEDQNSGNSVLSTIPLDSATLTNSFAAAQDYAAGTNPYGVATADLNGDGIPDLAVANNSVATVSVLLGRGDGTFATAVPYSVGNPPSAIVIGDFNRDGIPDLAVANYDNNIVSILLGKGDGTFQSQQTFAVGSYPSSIAVGDFNEDGIPDLAVANYSARPGTVSILLGNGDGTFQSQQTFAVGDAPFGIAVADLENNGTQDLIVANLSSDNISVLLGNGDGTFQPQVTYPVSVANNSAWAVTVGDFNGDGFPDVAAASGANVSVWLGTGTGTLNAAVGYNAGNTAYAIAAHDLFGNGKLDLVVVNVNGNNVSILAGNGNGTFGSPVNYSTSGSPQAITVGDFNGDGRPDLAVVTGVGNNANILLGEQTESATATGISVAGSGTQSVFASYPANANYASSVSGTIPLTGSQATLQVTANNATKVYGTANPTFAGTVSGGLPGASFTESFTTAAKTSSPAGSYAIVPSVTGTTVADYTQTIANGTLTVTQAGSTTTVSASPSAASPAQTVTLTAAVISQTSGTPTGTVTFLDNGVQLGTAANLSNGTATLAAPGLPAGATAVITAVYSGNTNFLTSTSTNSVSVVVAPSNFNFTNTGTAAYTAAPGAVATYSFSLSPLNGAYPGAVSFNATGLPTGATASFTPNSVTANGGVTPVTMTVQTAAAIAQNRNLLFGHGIVMALLFLPFLSTRRVREKLKGRMLMMILLMAGLTATLSGCASTNGFLLEGPQTYTLTVTATSGTLQNSQAVTLIVQ
jgi:sugar lactone lactonase YvrE